MRVKRMERIRIKLKNLIKISKIRERMNPPIPLVMKIIILFDCSMESFLCFIEHKNFHPKIHWKANHFQFLLFIERWKGHQLEGRISSTPMGQGEQAKGGVLKSLGEKSFWDFFLCDFSWKTCRMKNIGKWWKKGEWVECLGYFKK